MTSFSTVPIIHSKSSRKELDKSGWLFAFSLRSQQMNNSLNKATDEPNGMFRVNDTAHYKVSGYSANKIMTKTMFTSVLVWTCALLISSSSAFLSTPAWTRISTGERSSATLFAAQREQPRRNLKKVRRDRAIRDHCRGVAQNFKKIFWIRVNNGACCLHFSDENPGLKRMTFLGIRRKQDQSYLPRERKKGKTIGSMKRNWHKILLGRKA
jgi:hypothetical protein